MMKITFWKINPKGYFFITKKSKSKGFKKMNESDIKELEFKELWEQLSESNKNEIYGRLYEYIEEYARERRNNENYY